MVADCGLAVNKCINLLNLGYKILKNGGKYGFSGCKALFSFDLKNFSGLNFRIAAMCCYIGL